MTDQILHYVLDQSSGVVIALVLIFRMEKKMDSLEETFKQLLNTLLGVQERTPTTVEKQ